MSFFSTSLRTCALASVLGLGLATQALAQAPAAPAAPAGPPFTLTSPKHQDGAFLDKKYAGPTSPQMACGGENVSLPLQWSNAPANTKSFAVILFDFEGGRGPGVVHWVAYGIAPDVTSLAEGEPILPRVLSAAAICARWALILVHALEQLTHPIIISTASMHWIWPRMNCQQV